MGDITRLQRQVGLRSVCEPGDDMAETRTSCLLRLTLAVLIAVSTAQKAQEKWKVAVGGER